MTRLVGWKPRSAMALSSYLGRLAVTVKENLPLAESDRRLLAALLGELARGSTPEQAFGIHKGDGQRGAIFSIDEFGRARFVLLMLRMIEENGSKRAAATAFIERFRLPLDERTIRNHFNKAMKEIELEKR